MYKIKVGVHYSCMIDNKIKQQIKQLALQTDNEICGVIINNNVYPCQNISVNPQKNFTISPLDYLKINKIKDNKIDYIYHSHNQNSTFSEFDKINLYNLKLRGFLYSKKSDSFSYFFPESYQNKYVGRLFEIGISDCYSLICDYYQNELNIELPKIKRADGWHKKTPNIINENIPSSFIRIKLEESKKNDIIVFDLLNNNIPCHFGIYLENDLILHHPRNKLSTIELMSSERKKKIAYLLKYIWN